MPEKIITEDGTEREVPTDEEISNWKKAEAKNKDRKKAEVELSKKLGVEDGNIFGKVDELKEQINPNFKALRETNKNLKAALKEKGVEADDDGNITGNKEGLSEEAIQKIVDEGTDRKLAEAKRDEKLSRYTPEERKKIEPLLDRAMAMGGTMDENLGLLEAKLFPERKVSPVSQAFNGAGGGAPRPSNSEDKVTGQAVEIGKDLGVSKDALEKSGPLSVDDI